MAIAAHSRLAAAERSKLAKVVARDYEKGMSIRQLAQQHGTSISRIRGLITDGGASFRARGGATRASSTKS